MTVRLLLSNLYGTLTLNELDSRLQDIAKGRDIALRTTQSNSEGGRCHRERRSSND
jgi:3-dehydroquinate dehydratase